MEKTYDLIIIGAGSAGLTAAEFAKTVGANVALIEKDRVGGDCTWSGCVPSKTILKVAKVAHTVRTAADFGIYTDSPHIDMRQVWSHVQQVIQEIYSQETPEVLAEAGVDVVHGAARFIDAHTIEVGEEKLSAKNFLLAAGTRPYIPSIPGLNGSPFFSCQHIFDNDTLPQKLVILGAGATGVELAQVYGRLGASVTLVDVSILPSFDVEVGKVLGEIFKKENIEFVAGLATRIIYKDSQYKIATSSESYPEITADMLIVAAGRLPIVEGLGLDVADVLHDVEGVRVDKNLRTSAKHIYAAGDCTGGFQTTHYAGWQGYKAVRNMLLPGSEVGQREFIPIAVYTDPEIAHIGLSEFQAFERHGDSTHVIHHPLDRVDRAIIERAQDGFIKIMHKTDGTILGATIVSPRAGEIITEFEIALQRGLKIRDLAETMHVYPAYSMGVQRVAAKAATDQFFSGIAGRLARRLAGFTVS